jgi:aspartate/methionine/tyrosine aminotransferase/elongation factor P--beta-lysine ligase
VAGWIVARTQHGLRVVDGSAAVEFTAHDLDAQTGDLLVCRLGTENGQVLCSAPVVVARSTERARRTLESWDANDNELTYRHRYVHLRDPHHGSALRESWRLRQLVFDYFRRHDFTYVDTPILSRTQAEYTDDDFIVISRYTDRGVYTLPQSAQLYKQLLMGAGIWRYFQFSKCFRDEPTRADSLTEFTQIDVEVSFSTQESLMELAEDFVATMFLEFKGVKLERPFLRLSMEEALARHGTDKPALSLRGQPVGLFITDMPMAYRDERGALRGHHHPMMAPDPGHLPLEENDLLTGLRSTGFDLILGGIEVGSGNMRISDAALQHKILDRFGFSGKDREDLLGTLLEALEFAIPTHGGFGVGFERLLTLCTDRNSLQEVCAFPKLRRDWCPMSRSPFVPRRDSMEFYRNALNSIYEASERESAQPERRPLFPARPVAEAPTAQMAASLAKLGGCAFEMHIGDSHLPPPESFVGAIQARMNDAAMFRYSPPGGLPELREALAARHSRVAGAHVAPAQVLICNGATEGVSAIVRTALQQGERAMLLSPHWPLIRGQLHQHGCAIDEVHFFERGHAPSPERARALLESNFHSSTRLIYLANPNNPDGAVMSAETLRAILDFAIERDLWVISDEVYEEQVYHPARYVSTRAVEASYPRLVTVHAFSKLIGMPGIRVGFVIAHPEAAGHFSRTLQHTTYCVPALWQHGCLAALEDTAFFERQRGAFDEARVRTARALGVEAPAGGIYHFFEVRGESASIAESLMREVSVALTPGQVGGSHYGSWLRMCFTSLPPVRAEEGAGRVAQWLRQRQLWIERDGEGSWN